MVGFGIAFGPLFFAVHLTTAKIQAPSPAKQQQQQQIPIP